MTPEQMLAIADEFCAVYKVQVRSFAALAAVAAVPEARFHGVAVHTSDGEKAEGVHTAVVKLSPLTGENEAFAELCRQVYLRWAQENPTSP